MISTSSTNMKKTRQMLMSAVHSISDQPQSIPFAINMFIVVRTYYKGILECFLGGFCKRLVANDCNARMMRKRVLRGSITSSI